MRDERLLTQFKPEQLDGEGVPLFSPTTREKLTLDGYRIFRLGGNAVAQLDCYLRQPRNWRRFYPEAWEAIGHATEAAYSPEGQSEGKFFIEGQKLASQLDFY